MRWKACRECHQQYQLPHLNQHKGQNQRTQQLRAHTAWATGINSRVLVQIYGSNILQGEEKEACKAAWSGAESPCLISTEEHNEAGSLQLPTSNRLTYTPALTRELSAYPSLSLQRALCTTEARQKNLKSISEWEYLQFHFLQGVIYIAKAAGVQLVFPGLNMSAEGHRCAGSHTHTHGSVRASAQSSDAGGHISELSWLWVSATAVECCNHHQIEEWVWQPPSKQEMLASKLGDVHRELLAADKRKSPACLCQGVCKAKLSRRGTLRSTARRVQESWAAALPRTAEQREEVQLVV